MDFISKDSHLAVFGAGDLGSRVGDLWKVQVSSHLTSHITAVTRTPAKHAQLTSRGFHAVCESELTGLFSHVLIAFPPSGFTDYAGAVERALSFWNRDGSCIMVSSTGVYEEVMGGVVNEISNTSTGEDARVLLAAERVVLESEGSVIRCAGLYDHDRGPHRAYLRSQQTKLNPAAWMNLIHYEDAAHLCLNALLKNDGSHIYVGCDGQPITREALIELAMKLGVFESGHRPSFQFLPSQDSQLGKRCENAWTRQKLAWAPRWKSFRAWIQSEISQV